MNIHHFARLAHKGPWAEATITHDAEGLRCRLGGGWRQNNHDRLGSFRSIFCISLCAIGFVIDGSALSLFMALTSPWLSYLGNER